MATDRQLEFTVANIIGKLSDLRRIRTCENTTDLHGGIRCGHAVGQYRRIAKVAATLDLGKKFRRSLAPYRIGNAVHQCKLGDCRIVIYGHDIRNTECSCFGQLARTDAGNDMHTEFLRAMHGSAADASKRPANNDGLPILSTGSQPNELITCQHDKWNRRSIDQVRAVW